MPHEVTMPQLGMAQDAGRLIAWHKAPGDAVSKGEILFEVETDKATMEVEAQGDGYLTGVSAAEGEDVPVGQVIARITETAEDSAPPPQKEAVSAPAEASAALPEGRRVTMPQLGMAQDAGVLVGWSVALGDKVGAEDTLFEVETDKSTMEVPAGAAGYLAATLAEPGEEVPVGEPVAILTEVAPETTEARSRASAGSADAPAEAPPPSPEPAKAPEAVPAQQKPPAPAPGGRILASPKARRVALQEGLDLARLVDAGHPQPYHLADLEVLRGLPGDTPATAEASGPARRLTAEIETDGLPDFCAWVTARHGLDDADAVLAGLAGASLDAEGHVTVAIERLGIQRGFGIPESRQLGRVASSDERPDILVRDLRGTRLREIHLGSPDMPVLTLAPAGAGLSITLDCAAGQLDTPDAIRLISDFAGRVEDPLRHLL